MSCEGVGCDSVSCDSVPVGYIIRGCEDVIVQRCEM